jgi:hypothetical protein
MPYRTAIIAALSALPTLVSLPASAQQTPFDCQASAPHRAFDFWLGEWEVRNEAGELQGNNRITSVQRGCAIQESWRSVRGGTGQSINYYHTGTGQWRQLWNDAGASIIDISGGLQDGDMVLEGTIYYLKSGEERPFRGRWTPMPDGRVRQLFEQQADGGTWAPWFDGYYNRQ